MHNAAYDRLKARFGRIAALGEAAAMLHWDASTMMPPGGGESNSFARRSTRRVSSNAVAEGGALRRIASACDNNETVISSEVSVPEGSERSREISRIPG